MAILFSFIGIGCLIFGLSTTFGKDKFWWWSESTPVVPTAVVFGSFPFAFAFFVLAFLFQTSLPVEIRQSIGLYILMPLILIGIALGILQPKWLRWLETHHQSILSILLQDARKEEWNDWQKRVGTQEGLEEWVAEVRRKHGLE